MMVDALQGEHEAGGGFLGFLSTREAVAYRAADRRAKEAVEEFVWRDRETRIAGSMQAWRRCFPKATHANLSNRSDLRHHEFPNLRGVTSLNLSGCECFSICNDTFQYLSDLKELNLSGSWQDPTVWAVLRTAFDEHLFKHLAKLEILYLDDFQIPKFTGWFAAYLPRLYLLSLRRMKSRPDRTVILFKALTRAHMVSVDLRGCPWVHDLPPYPPNLVISS
jgi:hypothetical protein